MTRPEIERALRAAFEDALPALVRAAAAKLGEGTEPRPLTERDRARARAALRRAGLLPRPVPHRDRETAGG